MDDHVEPAADLSHVNPRGEAHIVDVGHKHLTRRTATAEAVVEVSDALAAAIAADAVKKGDVLAVARLAGIAAAKRTSDLIPLCHPLPIDGVDVTATLGDGRVEIVANVRTTWRTGVEMEALTAASVAALTVIDMGKAIDRAATIRHVRLLEKSGGTRGNFRADAPPPTLSAHAAAVLTVSDRCSRGEADDRSGPAVVAALGRRLGIERVDVSLVPDETDEIVAAVRRWTAADDPPALILTTGGTGLSPRDVTPEAVAPLIDRPCPQLLDLARQRFAGKPKAFLSRGVAGVIGRSLVVTLPGSVAGATEVFDALADVLPHALDVLRGAGDPHGRA